MKRIAFALYYSFPVQLVLLHFKKFQVLLVFWFILLSTLNSGFMSSYGANALFFTPEYLGRVDAISASIVGIATGIFIMSWNITSFILFCRHFKFLATTKKPFLKYCTNNFLIPSFFLIFYLVRTIQFDTEKEQMSLSSIALLITGFLLGLTLVVALSLLYFFRADKTIIRQMEPVIHDPKLMKTTLHLGSHKWTESRLIKVKWYMNSPFTFKKTRDVSHYSPEFIENVFNRHHFAAILSIFIAFIFLIIVGFFMDSPFFQLPAAASTLVFFAILISITGAFSYFLQSWSIPFAIALFLLLNLLYQYDIIDPTNKAYGLNYTNRSQRPLYTRESLLQLCTPDKVNQDMQNMIGILNRWKKRQQEEKPVLYIINTSGGGNRSAAFTMNILQRLDSISQGKIMHQTFLITGASGGMFGATYFRELWRQKEDGAKSLNLQDQKYVHNISRDLLNPLFSSFVARDLASPAQKFSVGPYQYIKDRGYAFEQKLSRNTDGLLDRQLKDLAADEKSAKVPLMLFNSVITRDSRMMVISTQPISFLMRPVYDSTRVPEMDPDAIDFQAFFAHQDPMNLRLLTALRMNATFPYVLPNVWLPTNPVIDVMDAGFRDNFGEQTAIRFVNVFKDWLHENTSGVVLIQIRDRETGGWDNPYESNDITEIATKPMLLLQYNWYKMQEYNQNDLISLSQDIMGRSFEKITFEYIPKSEDKGATLNFHLTSQEKSNILGAIYNDNNRASFQKFTHLLNKESVNP